MTVFGSPESKGEWAGNVFEQADALSREIPKKVTVFNGTPGYSNVAAREDHQHEVDLRNNDGDIVLTARQIELVADVDDIILRPTDRLQLADRNGYLPVGAYQSSLIANVAVPAGAGAFVITIANGIVVDLKAGDVVCAQLMGAFFVDVDYNVVYNYCPMYLGGVPTTILGGITGDFPTGSYGNTALRNGAFHTIPTTGTYTFTWTAATNVGQVTYLAGYCWLGVEVWGIR